MDSKFRLVMSPTAYYVICSHDSPIDGEVTLFTGSINTDKAKWACLLHSLGRWGTSVGLCICPDCDGFEFARSIDTIKFNDSGWMLRVDP